MDKKLAFQLLIFVILTIYLEQSIIAQKSVGINTEVKINISKKIGISFSKEIPNFQGSIISVNKKFSKRDVLVNYKTIQESIKPSSLFKPTLKIFRKKNNLLLIISNGSEQELRQVMYDDNILFSITKEAISKKFPKRHFVTIVY